MIESGTMTATRKAATAVLVRERDQQLQTLLLKRSGRGSFGNMWVFPGGAIEDIDRNHTTDPVAQARAAAARETAEEAGLIIAADTLTCFAHWTPPAQIPSRYLTWFFIAPLAAGTDDILVDNVEVTDHCWITPAQALEQHWAGELAMAPPTVVTLTELAEQATSSAAVAFYRRRGMASYRPKMLPVAEGEFVCLYEEDSGYVDADRHADGSRHRRSISRGRCRYYRS